MAYFVILGGGSGTRLWPLSRKNRPKHLLPFLNDKSLLEQTIERIKPIAQGETIAVVTAESQKELITSSATELFVEPSPRNTGPAILLSCLEIAEKSPEAVVVFLAADHFIPETKKYCTYLAKAVKQASKKDKIITLGLMPTHAATGYGYIQAKTSNSLTSSPLLHAGSFYDVKKFHEKPNLEKAEEYVRNGNMFWNLCMFIGKVSLFIEEYKKHAPKIYHAVLNYKKSGAGYEDAPATSIDFAVMEKSKNISVMPCDFEWTDVGNLNTFLSIQEKYGIKNAKIINIDGKHNVAKTDKKIVTFIGVDNICLIEDEDVIVVAKRDQVEKVKELQKTLKASHQDTLL